MTQPPGIHSPTIGSPMREVSPGVQALEVEFEESLYYPAIMADDPGHGDVSRWLDALPRDRRIVFPTVMNDKLIGMLERRGFRHKVEWSEEFGEWADIWVRSPGGADR